MWPSQSLIYCSKASHLTEGLGLASAWWMYTCVLPILSSDQISLNLHITRMRLLLEENGILRCEVPSHSPSVSTDL